MTRMRAEATNVTLYPDDWKIVDQVAQDYGHQGRSGALRYIIRDWARMKEQEAQAQQSPTTTADNE